LRILDRALGEIDVEFLQRLATEQVSESRTHDYRGSLPPARVANERDRFLETVASFANTEGGILVFGFREAAWELTGLPGFNPDGDVRRLEEMALRLDPPLPHLYPRVLTLEGGGHVLLIGVPQSFSAPHAVVYGNTGHVGYFRRNNRGKYPLDSRDVRRSFLEANLWRMESEQFRERRIALAEKWPGGSRITRTLLIHLLPIGRLDRTYDLAARRDDIRREFKRLAECNRRMNVDGLLYEAERRKGPESQPFWLQCFRHGGFEAGISLERLRGRDETTIDGEHLTQLLNDFALGGAWLLRELGVDPPYVLLISLLRVYAQRLARSIDDMSGSGQFFDRQDLLLPPVGIGPGHAPSKRHWPRQKR
jgi:hypothetical protein